MNECSGTQPDSRRFGLYLVMTDPVVGYTRCAEAAVECGVRYVQLRMKKEPYETVLEEGRRVRSVTRETGTLFIVNDSVELARVLDADGVHLGQDDMTLAEARRLWSVPGKIFGLSTHSEDQEFAARAVAPDYIGVGPVFATPTKAVPDPVLGADRAGAIVRNSPLIAVAIGGINMTNLAAVKAQGILNFAVVRAVTQSENPARAIRELQALWSDA